MKQSISWKWVGLGKFEQNLLDKNEIQSDKVSKRIKTVGLKTLRFPDWNIRHIFFRLVRHKFLSWDRRETDSWGLLIQRSSSVCFLQPAATEYYHTVKLSLWERIRIVTHSKSKWKSHRMLRIVLALSGQINIVHMVQVRLFLLEGIGIEQKWTPVQIK